MTSTALLDETLTSQALLDDPHAVYAELREHAPVFWHEPRKLWLITGYEEVRAAFRMLDEFSNAGWEHQRFLTLPPAVRERCPTLRRMLETPVVVQSDPPLHTRLRSLVNRSFTPRAIESSRQWLREVTTELFDRIEGQDEPDLGAELAYPLPIRAIVHLFGGVEADIPLYKQVASTRLVWGGMAQVDPELTVRYEAMLAEFHEYLRGLWSTPDSAGGQTLLSSLLARDATGEALSEDELFHACVVFLSAGHETTTSLIGGAIVALIRHPEQQQLVREDPSLVPALVEEALRWAAPVQRIQRIAGRDFEFGGRTIHQGDLISLVLAGANRDPRQFADADRFDVMRTDGAAHVGLGHGIHFCVGAGLARQETAIALELLLERVASMELVPDRPPRFSPSVNVRLVDSLPVRVEWR